MQVLVVGSGGREHAVVKKLAENPEIELIYCAPGNGGISVQATPVDIKAIDAAVSYTHLDVYKRQGKIREKNVSKSDVF